MIDYEMAKRTIQNCLCNNNGWPSLAAAHILPYGTNMKRWKLWEEDQCPRCHQPAESKEHVTQCLAPEAVALWTKLLQILDGLLQNLNMDPVICTKLIEGLTKWNQVAQQSTDAMKSPAAQEQDALGCDLLLKGRASKQWRGSNKSSIGKCISPRNQARGGQQNY